jgi:NarL family two-component system sensor histidine kinase LiaS
MILYRYLSLCITSFFFMIGNSTNSNQRKIFIIICISISSIIINYLIIKNRNSVSKLKILVLIETIGISVILIPTGGLGSPYIWYALNTLLVTSIELHRKYFWINLLVYFISAVIIPNKIILRNRDYLFTLMLNESNIIISFVLISSAILLLSNYIKNIQSSSSRLIETNKQLLEANQNVKETMNYVMELYQAVHLFTSQTDKQELVNLLIHYTKEITKAKIVIFFPVSKLEKKINISGDNLSNDIQDGLNDTILNIYRKKEYFQSPKVTMSGNKKYILACVKSNSKVYGILAIETPFINDEKLSIDIIEQVLFLSELGSIFLERFELDEIKDRLIVTEEQNRIASEIHDNVLQRLFSISCGIFGIVRKSKNVNEGLVVEELNSIRKAIDSAMRDLRATIYGLSWTKNGSDTFRADINTYIDEIKRFNNVDVILNINGNCEYLTSYQKKALYRIICEGIGNALRHGKANNIDIICEIKYEECILKIFDDGIGFDVQTSKNNRNNGLGLKNMYSLAHFVKGNIFIESQIGSGTTIKVIIPNSYQDIGKAEVV